MQNKWVIFGCGGHARSIADVILYNDRSANIVFVDQNAGKNETLLGFPVLPDYTVTNEKVAIGVGNNSKRITLSLKYYNNLVSVYSKNAYVSHFAKLGKGVFIGHHAHIGVLTFVNDFVVVNTSASIDHDCELQTGSFIGPNATLCGKVLIGEASFVGASAVVRDKITVSSNIIIGTGAVVVENLTEKGTYVGVPARQLRITP